MVLISFYRKDKHMIHSFLLIGQSNAAGRGFIDEAEPLDTCTEKIKVLRNGRWQTAFRPINPDRPFSGTCLAESFAKAYLNTRTDVEVGIIPCADGGTTLEQWAPGGLLFENAVMCSRLAMRTSRLVGILWHQGEGDCAPEKHVLYEERFQSILDALRQELNLPDVPVIVGGLGDFLSSCSLDDNLKNYNFVNQALQNIAKNNKNTAFASAEGLGANPDNLHFSAAALNELGVRYFEKFKPFIPDNFTDARLDFDNVRSAMEAL